MDYRRCHPRDHGYQQRVDGGPYSHSPTQEERELEHCTVTERYSYGLNFRIFCIIEMRNRFYITISELYEYLEYEVSSSTKII